MRSDFVQSGFSLVEALIASLVFSIGVLSMVAAQATAKQYVFDAQLHSEAMHHASSLVAQMRLADPMTLAGDYSSPTGSAYVVWRDLVSGAERGLPGASAMPPRVTIAGKTVTVQVYWTSPAQQGMRQLFLETELE